MNNSYEYVDDDDYFQNEVNAFERVGRMGPTATKHEMQNDPVKRFKVYVNAYATFLHTNSFHNSLKLNQDDITLLNDMADKLERMNRSPQYKNFMGFVLGYLIFKKKQKVSASALQIIGDSISLIQQDKLLKLKDVLRYGFFWESLLKNL
jgi:hypothetical protein